jgi:hypothetical protein
MARDQYGNYLVLVTVEQKCLESNHVLRKRNQPSTPLQTYGQIQPIDSLRHDTEEQQGIVELAEA